ncbi:MAG: pitrilysin family protein [Bacteroidota bacterium]
MIDFQQHELSNGLKVFVHEDHSSKTAVLNLLYCVGSRNERPDKTGFAHLFEHLMFGGSKNIDSFDEPLQAVGGENNAFTSTDITNYYITLPGNNLETAFWLESDRMMELSFNPKILEVQRKVVIEEFKQRYLNQPYGDIWLKLRPLAYQVHPYQWATIGKEISHIEEATMEDVKDFFHQYYRPNNAILVVAGDVKEKEVLELAQKWFGNIPVGENRNGSIPSEPRQSEARHLEVEAEVPLSALYKAYHMPGRGNKGYYTADLIGDLLGRSKSSILYQELVKKEKLFNSINAYITGSADPGLLMVSGKVNEGVDLEEADKAVEAIVYDLASQLEDEKIEKVKNQAESTLLYSEVEVLNRAMNIAYGSFLGDPNLVNTEIEMVQSVQKEDMLTALPEILRKDNCSTLYYRAKG